MVLFAHVDKDARYGKEPVIGRKACMQSAAAVAVGICVIIVVQVWSGISAMYGTPILSSVAPSSVLSNDTTASVCSDGRRAVLYNKAPKTASSFIEATIVDWARATGRPLYQCYLTPMMAMVHIRSCLPEAGDPCGVFPSHVYLNAYTMQLFEKRLPGHLLVTSTRYPPHRMVSMFLFIRKLRDNDPAIEKGLATYIENYNPWRLYNYHTGEYMTGSCPLSEPERRRVWSVVSKFDVVIDLNSIRASNVILRHKGLFTLPNVTDLGQRQKERGTVRVNVSDHVKSLLAKKVCVEVELHRAMQLKMARLYEEATGRTCLFDENIPTLDTCILREESQTLKGFWKI